MKNYEAWADEVIGKIREKMEWVSDKNRDKIPYTTDENGNYDRSFRLFRNMGGSRRTGLVARMGSGEV